MQGVDGQPASTRQGQDRELSVGDVGRNSLALATNTAHMGEHVRKYKSASDQLDAIAKRHCSRKREACSG